MRRAPAVAALLLALVACKKPAPPAPVLADFDVTLDTREDCLHHATAIARVEGGTLVFGACGHIAEGDSGEEILGVRVDDKGRATTVEPVDVLEAGWATNLLAAPIAHGGALVAWTAAIDRAPSVHVAPVDEQGHPAGEKVALGPGRAAALASGPRGAALALLTVPDSLSDAEPGVDSGLELVVVDADGVQVSRGGVSRRIEAAHAQVALAGDASGYALVWSEAGLLTATHTDAAGTVSARGAIVPDPTTLGLPAGARFHTPALAPGAHGSASVVAIVEVPGAANEIWSGEGTIGAPEREWKWQRLVGAGRYGHLAMERGWLAFSDASAGGEFPSLRVMHLGESAPRAAIARTVLLDGAVALATTSVGDAAIVAAAEPPVSGAQNSLRVVQRAGVAIAAPPKP
jgi:hypothetical protein